MTGKARGTGGVTGLGSQRRCSGAALRPERTVVRLFHNGLVMRRLVSGLLIVNLLYNGPLLLLLARAWRKAHECS